ncbi:multidrug ABC transporter ATP-binding protein [Gammaproteobacteria bacterium 45_16_T64]|nr:multidrug ABC transporter ATP-binding protein [Gammaproteobacteria bacterium 45_16_T64]
MITVDNLTKRFGPFTAVGGLSFTVKPGEVLGFLGPNGAGKSTTMKMITGFLAPTSGQVTVFGHNVQEDSLAASTVMGYLPEGAPSYGDMSPLKFLRFVGEVRGFKGRELSQRVDSVVQALQLSTVLNQPIDTLSKGFKRRVGLAQAIIHDPKVLVLDEPTDGLDPNQKHEVRKLIQNLSKDKIVIVSTHILEEVTAVCTRAMIIAGGKLLVDDTPDALAARSRLHGAIRLQLSHADDAYQQLSGLAGVDEIERGDQADSLTVYPKKGVSLFLPINQLLQQNSWEVHEFHVERGRLDDVFRDLTQGGCLHG